MRKDADTKYEIHPLLKSRWSPRAFSDKMVEPEKIRTLFEAARWAPSGSNQQSWRFIIGFKGDDTYDKIFQTLVEFNQLWAKTAPVLIISLGKKVMNNKDEINPSYHYDVGQAVAHLTFQACYEGLWVHQMGGFDVREIVELFNVPAMYKPITITAIGYMGDYTVLHPNLQKLELNERERKGLDELVFSGVFGNKTDLFT